MDDDLAAMYQVAEDWEADVLDQLRRRAGVTWECDCPGGWTNLATETNCAKCGKPRLVAGVDYEEAACDNCGRSDRHTPTELAVCIDSVLGPPRTEDE